MIQRCHSLKNSHINLKSDKKLNKQSTNQTIEKYQSLQANKLTTSPMPSVKKYQIHESPVYSHHTMSTKEPLKINLQRSIETNCTTSSKKPHVCRFLIHSRMSSNQSQKFMKTVEAFDYHLKNYESANIRIEEDESKSDQRVTFSKYLPKQQDENDGVNEINEIIKEICRKIDDKEKKIKCYKDMIRRKEERYRIEINQKIQEKETIKKHLIDLYKKEKEENEKIMREMEWASIKSSPIKPRMRTSNTNLVYSQSSDEKRRMTAHFSFLEMSS